MVVDGGAYDFLAAPSWEVAPLLLGWLLTTELDGVRTSIELTEVEAYDQNDPASHSYRGPTARTATMFGPPGVLYVYRSYGIHWCVNIVTGPPGHGAAVLLRAGRPTEGVDRMIERRGRSDHIADGPGKLTQALGITGDDDGVDATSGGTVRLIPGTGAPTPFVGVRVGITKAVSVPWRFFWSPSE